MVIKDTSLDPYVIEADRYNYTVYIPKVSKKGGIYRKDCAYFSYLGDAVKYVAEQQLVTTDKVFTLREFLKEYQELVNKIDSSISIE